jgi:L-aspartate oxidase
LDGAFLRGRFPRIFETCLRHGFDLTRQRVPVAPAAHYAMGGVWTDLDGRTSLPGLFAAGEVACTGVHGANRLASNSLLEGIVFGARAGRAMRDAAGPLRAAGQAPAGFPVPLASEEEVRRIAWEHCGVVRSGQGLQAAIQALEARATGAAPPRSPEDAELRNMHQVALLIARAALARRESRGAHFREEVTSSA